MASETLSAWSAKRAGNLNRFYTHKAVGEVLTSSLGDIDPHLVVDLGAGEGSLSSAVVARWQDARVTTVDIDDTCAVQLHERLLSAGAIGHTHRILDVLDADLPAKLGGTAFDLAVCNPPFFKPEWTRSHADILREADFIEACPRVADVTAEILFFAQNLRLVREGGTIALIVPDGLATGWRARSFRRALLSQHTLVESVQLPQYSFSDTEAYCFILVVRKGKSAKDHSVKLGRLEENGTVSESLWVKPDVAEARLDWAYHAAANSHDDTAFTLRQLGAEVRRGSVNSVQRRAAQYPVFHTGDFPAPGEPVALPEPQFGLESQKLVIAEAGDILMARVDRELHQKITLVTAGQTAITDCLYRVRVPEVHRQRAFEALASDVGRDRIRAVTKGVGARLLGKGDLLDLPLMPAA